MIYQIKSGRVMFAADTVFEHVDFEIKNKNDKIAVIGRNGAGKTTLLRVIANEIEMTKVDGDEPQVSALPGITIGYLRQITFDDLSLSVDDEIRKVFAPIIREKERIDELVGLMDDASGEEAEKYAKEYTSLMDDFRDRGGYYYEKEYDAMLVSFGFSNADKARKLSEFSGGQLTKLAFIKLLLSRPDILLLDEPTNHLDMSTISWLEDYLKNYNRAVVIVSHDRMFLDRIVNVVYEITYGTVTRFTGNYTDYVAQKKERYEKQLKDHIAQQKEIKRLTELVERFKNKPSKVAMTRSKLKQIEHMELVARPADYDTKSFHAEFKPKAETGKDVLFAKDLVIGYDQRALATINLDIKKGERLAIIGDNGIGKSTLLKTLVGDIKPISGDFRFGVNVQIGYFDQRMAQYTSDKTVINDYWDMYPTLTETQVRNQLGGFLFTQDEVYKDVSMLSGGERVRLCLAKIFHTLPNVLILDEPTNHMDMIGKETLEAMLSEFAGTVIFVSHDRYFVKKVATVILDMRTDGVTLYRFGYDDYVEKVSKGSAVIDTKTGQKSVDDTKKSQKEPSAVTDSQAARLAGKEAEKKQRRIKKLEEKIEEVESRIEDLKEELCKAEYATDYDRLSDIQGQIDAAEEELLETMQEWERQQ
ncbi:MAG: ABC-F family ATP-binding cassette domain-containing protein [Lachnospiraceae bacterium]|nr:ABC-F family ATP-binding cassette domain-containing protein [Lachnospiraceae bacterium]